MSDSRSSTPEDDSSAPLLHFEGPWTAEDKQLARQAVREAESNELPSARAELGAVWVLTCFRDDGTSVYAATRQGLRRGFSAQSPEVLARKIRAAAEDAP